jgi:16S rRNA (uracil1498-N3)-methyltransferase
MTQHFQKQSAEAHLFSLFYSEELDAQKTIVIKDPLLLQRILTILRLKKNDSLLLFNKKKYGLVKIESVDEKKHKTIECSIQSIEPIQPLNPPLTLYVGIVKKNNWSEIMYAAAQLGVTEIVPLITERSQKELPEVERLTHVMIAACEQSKQYQLPYIKAPISIDQIEMPANNVCSFFADAFGAPLASIVPQLSSTTPKRICIGPEAGLTDNDQATLKSKGFTSIALTPTILRTIDATALFLGIIRSFDRE